MGMGGSVCHSLLTGLVVAHCRSARCAAGGDGMCESAGGTDTSSALAARDSRGLVPSGRRTRLVIMRAIAATGPADSPGLCICGACWPMGPCLKGESTREGGRELREVRVLCELRNNGSTRAALGDSGQEAPL